MFKNIEKSDSSLKRLDTYSNHTLSQSTAGVNFLTGVSGSSIVSESANWNWTNGLFYNQNYGQWGEYVSYKASEWQERNLQSHCRIIAIPNKYIGRQIKPGTLEIDDTQGAVNTVYVDNGSGSLYVQASSSTDIVGNVFYKHGIAVLTDTGSFAQAVGTDTTVITFKSSHYIYEHNYLCRMGNGEFNSPTNPSAVYGSDASSTSGSNEIRHPGLAYVTSIGLYDDKNRLLAIARLAKPLFNDPEQSIAIHLRFDM